MGTDTLFAACAGRPPWLTHIYMNCRAPHPSLVPFLGAGAVTDSFLISAYAGLGNMLTSFLDHGGASSDQAQQSVPESSVLIFHFSSSLDGNSFRNLEGRCMKSAGFAAKVRMSG